jgi:hypothetical protein
MLSIFSLAKLKTLSYGAYHCSQQEILLFAFDNPIQFRDVEECDPRSYDSGQFLMEAPQA